MTVRLVGTPIGNLGDLAPRAAEALLSADVIACEDTRRTGKLLAHLRHSGETRRPPMVVLNDHSDDHAVADLVERAVAGETVVVATDAGMPVVSDPGHRLVTAAVAAGLTIDVVPGPSALDTAVAGSAMVAGPFCFEGFLPRKGAERARRLDRVAAEDRPIVLFEAPHRLAKTLGDLAAACGPLRPVHLARELTKLHQERWWGTLQDAQTLVADHEPRGEYVLVVAPAAHEAPSEDQIDEWLRDELGAGASVKAAAAAVATLSGRSRRELYQRALDLGDRTSGNGALGDEELNDG